jgi:hypothetical protein
LTENSKHEVYRGHFEECLRHLGTSLASSEANISRGAAQVKKPVADFCGVSIQSVTRWLNDTGSFPVGEPYIKLMCFLDMMGYRVIELERMPKVHRNFAELIGYGLLSSVHAAEFLGYSYTSTLYKVLQGHYGVSEDKEQKMWDAWKERKEELILKKEKSQELYRLDIPLKIRPKAEKSKSVMSASRQTATVNIMEGLLSLLEDGSLSESSLADLQRSADTILRLSAHLSALSSRLIMSEQRKGGS